MTENRKKQGLHTLYTQNPEQADWLVFGRRSNPLSRRGFLKGSGLAAVTAILGAPMVFAEFFPGGLIPAALAQSDEPFEIPGKDGLRILNDRPLNAETPAHLLDDAVTPASRLFVRNNGIPPEEGNIDPDTWVLSVDGEACETPTQFGIGELQQRFANHTYQLQLECGGNGRSEFFPPARGNQWTTGAIGCPTFTGVRLRDVLEACGIKDNAVYVGYYGSDTHPSGDSDKVVISRGVPMEKALQDETLIAWAMNDEPLPLLHGYPLRLVASGYPASASGKWINKLVIRDQIHDGPKMTGKSYRVPCKPVAPGTDVPDEAMCIIEGMPVKSLVTSPRSGVSTELATQLPVSGKAWAGEQEVREMYVSIDFGQTWQRAELDAPVNRYAWQLWRTEIGFPQTGYYEIWVRAVDDNGNSQPTVIPGWNPRGYLNNACHRIAVQVV